MREAQDLHDVETIIKCREDLDELEQQKDFDLLERIILNFKKKSLRVKMEPGDEKPEQKSMDIN